MEKPGHLLPRHAEGDSDNKIMFIEVVVYSAVAKTARGIRDY